MRKFFVAMVSVACVLMSVSCETAEGFLMPDQHYSLAQIRKAIGAVSGKPRHISQNEREFLSPYFSRKPSPTFDPEKTFERLYAHFWILGDRRPYDIRVQVLVEHKDEDGYSVEGEDVNLSKKVADELKDKLVQGQDGSNVIDSFRPF